jgi:hypothetical protein
MTWGRSDWTGRLAAPWNVLRYAIPMALVALLLSGCSSDRRAYPGSYVSLDRALPDYGLTLPDCAKANLRYYASSGHNGMLALMFIANRECVDSFISTLGAEKLVTVYASQLPFNAADFVPKSKFGWTFEDGAPYDEYRAGPRTDIDYDTVVGPVGNSLRVTVHLLASPLDL